MAEKKLHSVWTDYDVRVPLRDGVRLSADVCRPVETREGARLPVILVRTPYQKTSKLVVENSRYFAERGYVVVYMDVRGRGDSEGEFVPYRNEGPDGYDSVEWCAAQSWSTGDVGTLGGSYLGHIQWLTALEKPPHLRTMVPLVSPSDPFVEWPTGTRGLQHICWLHLVGGRVLQNIDDVDWMPIYEHLPLNTMDEALGRPSRLWKQDYKHTRLDDYWDPLCYQKKFDQIDLPVLHISGWYDDEQIGTPLNFRGMIENGASENARRNQKLLMGPWGHAVNTVSKLGEVDFGADSLIDLRADELRWFDYWLKGEANGVTGEPRVRMFVMGENKWRDETEWPLARTRFTPFYLHSGGRANSRMGDGALSKEPPAAEAADGYHNDPTRPVPFLTDPRSSQIGGPDDYAAIQRRDDVLVYVTEPLPGDTEITGPIHLRLFAATTAPDSDFMAMLTDVHPTGFVQRMCDGMVRARFRQGMDAPALVEAGQVYEYDLDLWNTCQVFKAGHRIGLQIASTGFPKYDRNANTGGDLATETRLVACDQTILHDVAHPSALILPIIPR